MAFADVVVSKDTVEPTSPLVNVFSQTTVVRVFAVDEATWVQPETPVGPDQLTDFARVNTSTARSPAEEVGGTRRT